MKNVIFILVMLVIAEMGFGQKRSTNTVRPPNRPIVPVLPIYTPSPCPVDFVVLKINVTKVSNSLFRYEAYVRNQGTETYTMARGATAPMIVAYTFSEQRPEKVVTFTKLKPGEAKVISGQVSWPTNNEFLPPINVTVNQFLEFDTQHDCDRSNNKFVVTSDQIKDIMNRR
ncbi:MAG: hypothetical protein IPO14_10890 [Saprospiraceae bacterium]|jgi:hypothetical protein|nr:hypothetical protein [Saprospiraceae bacterium]